MTAVAVWTRKPTPDTILEARIEAGWEPTPTMMQGDGPVILGHAACRFSPG